MEFDGLACLLGGLSLSSRGEKAEVEFSRCPRKGISGAFSCPNPWLVLIAQVVKRCSSPHNIKDLGHD